MLSYDAPTTEFRFLLQDVFDYENTVTTLPDLGDVDIDTVIVMLESAGDFAKDVLLPINLPGDSEGCHFAAGHVTTPAGYKEAYDLYRRNGWPTLSSDPRFGGQGLPTSLGLMVREIIAAGSMSFGMYAGLTQGAYRAILAHGNEELQALYLPPLAEGCWTGTMCMTEPQSGSDLSLLRTRAVPDGNGAYRITGTKIFISGGDHDLTENIVHLVLARLPDGPPGTRGISLFLVPKLIPTGPNGVSCGSIEHKMGICGSATALLNFDGAQGWLIGELHGGTKAMFTMMNSSRVGVAVQSVGAAEISYQNAVAYAKSRRQGRAPNTAAGDASAIIEHADIRKTLLTMRAWVEGIRAFYVDSAIALDVRSRHPDAALREATDNRLSLLTPILKSFVSECALEVTSLGIQVFGGHGYIHENGMEQLYRDARVVPLYEGTNTIQALDLVGRKIPLDDGQAVELLFGKMDEIVRRTRGTAALLSLAAKLADNLTMLRASTHEIQKWRVSDIARCTAVAADYLRQFGLVALGGVWLQMAEAALRVRANRPAMTTFCDAKLQTAHHYFARLLPEAALRHDAVLCGYAEITNLVAEAS